MSQKMIIKSLKPLIRYNKNFIYKGKTYPIDFRLVKTNSNYFYEMRHQYKNRQDIEITDELIDISEESIPAFISSLHSDSFEINESNVFSLNQLSMKYKMPNLISLTEEFIKKYDKTLIFRSIQYKYQLQKSNDKSDSIDLTKDEEYIATNIFNYINDDQLLDLPISILYRIINNPKLNINQLNENDKNQLIDFLFKCLNKYKKEASILFLNLDLENQRIEIFSKLINEYSNVFDFNMINPKFLMKTASDLLSELANLKLNYANSISQVNQLLNQIKKEKQNQQEIFDSFKQFAQDQIKEEHEKLNESFQNLKKQNEEEKQKQQDLFNSFKQSVQDQIKEEHEKLNESFQNLKNQNEEEKQKQQDLFNSFKQFAQNQMKEENEKLNESFQNLKKQNEEEKQKQQDLFNSFKQSAQDQIKEEHEKLNESFQNLKKQIDDENRSNKNEITRNIDDIKSLVNQHNSKIETFITKDVLNIYIFL